MVRVELYGLPRHRAGLSQLEVEAGTLGELCGELGAQAPALRGVCLSEAGLANGYLANLNGRRFVSDPATRLQPGDCVLILSADVGG